MSRKMEEAFLTRFFFSTKKTWGGNTVGTYLKSNIVHLRREREDRREKWMILLVLVSVVSLCCHLVTADVGRNSTQGVDDAWFLEKVVEHEAAIFALSKIHVFRLGPNEDLLLSLFRYARVTGIEAAMILTCVGRFVFF